MNVIVFSRTNVSPWLLHIKICASITHKKCSFCIKQVQTGNTESRDSWKDIFVRAKQSESSDQSSNGNQRGVGILWVFFFLFFILMTFHAHTCEGVTQRHVGWQPLQLPFGRKRLLPTLWTVDKPWNHQTTSDTETPRSSTAKWERRRCGQMGKH